jgi:hypothetical protein
MTSTAKTTAATNLDTGFLVDGQTADAGDVLTPFNDAEEAIDQARETVSVSPDDTHVKHLDDALAVSPPLTKAIQDAAGDESLMLTAGTKLTALDALLSAAGKVQAAAVDSEAATSGYALVANGSGGVSWADASGGGATPVDVNGTAGEALAERDLVYLAGDGEWYKLDIDADPIAVGWPRGVVNESGGIAAAATGSIRLLGEVAGFSGLAPGALVYASTTAGAATQTKPVATGGGQVAIVPVGVAVSSTTVLVLPYFRSRFVKRETLAADGTLTVEHFDDEATRTREVRALNNVTGDTSLASYGAANQDADVALKGPSAAGGTTSGADTGGDYLIGYLYGADRQLAQSFQVAAGRLSQFKVTLNANTGSPTGDITWRIETDDSGLPSGDLVDDGLGGAATGSFTPVPSSENTINVTDGVLLAAGTAYWLVLSTSESEGNGYNWDANIGTYADGMLAQASSGAWSAQPSIDAHFAVTTSAISAKDRLAQGFQIGSGASTGEARLYLKKVGSPTGDLTLKLYTDSGGEPDALVTDGTSNAVAASSLSSSYGWITFTFPDPPALSASTTYWLVLETTDSASDDNHVVWGADASTPSYADGEMKSEASSTWSAESKDAVFNVFDAAGDYVEPMNIGSWSLEDAKVAARFDDGSGASAATQTTFKNKHTASLDLTCEVVLP